MGKKKNLYNLIMAAAILVIFVAGIMIVGHLRGWFGGGQTVVARADGTQKIIEITVESKKGNVNLMRDGVSFALDKGTSLRDKDGIETRMGSALTLVSGENILYLDERSEARIHVTEEGIVQIELVSGGVFGVISEPFALKLMEEEITTEGAVFFASAPYGSAGMHIFEKNVTVAGQQAEAGQAVSILKSSSGDENEIQITELSLQSLNSFELACAALARESHTLCFTPKEMEELMAQRQQAVADAGMTASDDLNEGETPDGTAAEENGNEISGQNSAGMSGSGDGASQAAGGDSSQEAAGNGGSAGVSGGSTSDSGNSAGSSTGTPAADGNGGGSQGSTAAGAENPSGGNAGSSTDSGQTSEPEPSKGSCTIQIVCDTILNNMDALAPGKDSYVPSNGVILSTSTISFSDGETVFDVLKRSCSSAGIQLEYSWTPMYNSYYVEGINNLYEFDCGGQSGWMYEVNGWFPNYGCSSYTLTDGDTIVWRYTCNGLGEDVGGNVN